MKTTKYFYDCEFNEDGKTIELISIGFVSEDGRKLYLENTDIDFTKVNPWVKENVIPHLWSRQKDKSLYNEWSLNNMNFGGLMSKKDMSIEIERFCNIKNGKPEFWGYYSAYDFVALCQIFGTMMELPEGYSRYTNDLKQLAVSLGNPKLPDQNSTKHNALADAEWNKQVYEFLLSLNK